MQDETSPCGLVRVEWQLSTGLMSHEINSPRFIDARSGTPFLTLWDEQWDANVRWDGDGRFRLSLRNYGRPGNVEADVDVAAQRVHLIVPPAPPQPLADADRAVRSAFEREVRQAMPRPPAAPRGNGLVVGFAAILAILIGLAFYGFG